MQAAYPPPQTSSGSSYLWIGIGILLLVGVVYIYFNWSVVASVSNSVIPTAVDGTSGQKLGTGNFPSHGSDYSMQYWMYIDNWDYRFGEDKSVVVRTDSTNSAIMNPNVSLDPVNNSLNIGISIYSGGSTQASADASGGSTDDHYTCTVENVPLQSWFAVSLTVFQKNVDVYINGKLVKSCVLPGIPKPALGEVVIGAGKGFSGLVCGLVINPGALSPAAAATFYAAGTPCAATTTTTTSTAREGWSFLGYTWSFGVYDRDGTNLLTGTKSAATN